jgi:hypothetical protein
MGIHGAYDMSPTPPETELRRTQRMGRFIARGSNFPTTPWHVDAEMTIAAVGGRSTGFIMVYVVHAGLRAMVNLQLRMSLHASVKGLPKYLYIYIILYI